VPPRYDRYGVQRNPFTTCAVVPFRPPLPIRPVPPPDYRWRDVVPVDGFSGLRPGEMLHQYLTEQIQKGSTPCFVVVGARGTGRSTAARAILEMFRTACGVEEKRFLVPDPGELNHDPWAVYQNWLENMRDALQGLENVALATVEQALEDAILETEEKRMSPRYRRCMSAIATMLSGAEVPARFGVCLENVETYQLVQTAAHIFASAKTVCVFTTLNSEVGNLVASDAVNAGHQVVRLGTLDGDDVAIVVNQYWKEESKDPSPFPEEVLKDTIAQGDPSLGRVLRFTAALFHNKARQLRDGPAWPADGSLRFSREDVEDFQSEIRLITDFGTGEA
jgi:hypothetical protein